MTDTASAAPSDLDIDATWDALPGISIHNDANARGLDTQTMLRRAFARAVLAKWGQPAQAAEPVAWRVHPFDYGIGHEGVYAMTMREEQREAWRRKGWNTEPLFAAPQPVAREPSGHIKEPYTLAEIKAKIASNDYSAEMLLQHAMLLLDSASLSANAGEPRNAIDRDALIDAIAQCLHGTWHCTRVWESWHVGTMSQDDFEPVDESETPTEIADAVLALLAAPGPADGERAIGEKMVLDPCCGSLVFMKP